MWQRLLIAFLLAVLAYFVVRWFSGEKFTNWDSVVSTPGSGPLIRPPPVRGDMNVAAGGPNPPNVAAPRNMPAVMPPPPDASDPYSETAEDAYAPENIRHPERSFSPGLVPDQTAIAVGAGTLSTHSASTAQAMQTFSPDFVQNGGTFFGTVSAMEDENPNYTAF